MRKALSLVLAVAIAVIGTPISALAAEKNARRPAAQPKTGNVEGNVTGVQPGQTVTVQIRDSNGQLVGNPVTPDSGGLFRFTGLTPGTYTVELVQGTNVVPLTITVEAGRTATLTFSGGALRAAVAAAGRTGGLFGMKTTLAVSLLAIGGITVGVLTYRALKDEASPSR